MPFANCRTFSFASSSHYGSSEKNLSHIWKRANVLSCRDTFLGNPNLSVNKRQSRTTLCMQRYCETSELLAMGLDLFTEEL